MGIITNYTKPKEINKMTVKIEFRTDSAPFYWLDKEWEINKVLKRISHKIEQGYLKDDVRDANGTIIGSFEVN